MKLVNYTSSPRILSIESTLIILYETYTERCVFVINQHDNRLSFAIYTAAAAKLLGFYSIKADRHDTGTGNLNLDVVGN